MEKKGAGGGDYLESLLNKMKSAAAPFRDVLRDIHARNQTVNDGAVATYIPELAKANPDWFGLSVVTTDGQIFDVGDAQQLFTIQSISKPFVFGLALEEHGREHVLTKVGVEPTGDAFNSIVLDESSNRPFNPMVNAGAIATTDLVPGKDFPGRLERMMKMFARYCGRDLYIDNGVFLSERATGHRNRAMAHLMLNFGMVSERVEETLELYFQQCSILVNSHDLAVMGATLANAGVNPLTNEPAIRAEYVKDMLAAMLSCGMYNYAGEWAYKVGIPAKSGVAGGLIGVIPGQMGIAVFSPRLDSKGNTIRGIKVFEELSERFGLHVFEAGSREESIGALLKPKRTAVPAS
jgi:glutaminase